MPFSSTSIVRIPVQEIWINDGLKYGQISWTQTFNRMGKASPYKKIQNIAIGKIAEDAVKNYLKSQNLSFDMKGSTKWYEIDIDDLEIKNFQVDIKSNLIDVSSTYIKKKNIGPTIDARLAWYNKCHALVPSDQVAAKNRGNKNMNKLYIFVFVEGKINQNKNKNLIHAFWDYKWLKKAEYKEAANLGLLTFTSSSKTEYEFTVYGTTAPKEGIIERLTLKDGIAISKNSYHQVFAIYSHNGIPDSAIKIESKEANLTEIVHPILRFEVDSTKKPIELKHNDWNSVDIQIDHCYIAGWIKKEDFLVISKEYPRFTKIFEQYEDTLTSNFACQIQELEPMELIENA